LGGRGEERRGRGGGEYKKLMKLLTVEADQILLMEREWRDPTKWALAGHHGITIGKKNRAARQVSLQIKRFLSHPAAGGDLGGDLKRGSVVIGIACFPKLRL